MVTLMVSIFLLIIKVSIQKILSKTLKWEEIIKSIKNFQQYNDQ